MTELAQLEAEVAYAERERDRAFEAWQRSRWPEKDAYFAADMALLHARLNLDDYQKENGS
ncbi:hypothetical protein MTsN4n12_02470 [Microbacterium sp. MTN4-12]